jgi:hypothetical protein
VIPFFAGYAVLVWYAAARWRRRWESFAWVAAGVAGLVLVALFHLQLSRWTHGGIYLPVLQWLLYPYTGLVAAIGLYLSCLPRTVAEAHCAACGYDLAGLPAETGLCPECGAAPDLPLSPGRPATESPQPGSARANRPAPAIGAPSVCLDPGDQ